MASLWSCLNHFKGSDNLKLERFLQKAGIASRRKASGLIEAGTVTVNGEVCQAFWKQVDPETDRVEYKGERVLLEKKVYYKLNKPQGYICALEDPFGTPTIVDYLTRVHAIDKRVHPVGRLDKDTEGLLLLTNDGDFTYRILHPKMKIEKEYLAKVKGRPDESVVEQFKQGIQLRNFKTAPAVLKIEDQTGQNTWVRIIIKEGKKRQVKRMCSFLGHKVLYLKRLRVDSFTLDGVENVGDLQKIPKEEIDSFMKE